jgi:hypothetical protein
MPSTLPRVCDAGNVVDRAVRIGAVGVAEHHLAVVLDGFERFSVGEIVAVVVGNRAAPDLAFFELGGEAVLRC